MNLHKYKEAFHHKFRVVSSACWNQTLMTLVELSIFLLKLTWLRSCWMMAQGREQDLTISQVEGKGYNETDHKGLIMYFQNCPSGCQRIISPRCNLDILLLCWHRRKRKIIQSLWFRHMWYYFSIEVLEIRIISNSNLQMRSLVRPSRSSVTLLHITICRRRSSVTCTS